jgi:hypothetical protein
VHAVFVTADVLTSFPLQSKVKRQLILNLGAVGRPALCCGRFTLARQASYSHCMSLAELHRRSGLFEKRISFACAKIEPQFCGCQTSMVVPVPTEL